MKEIPETGGNPLITVITATFNAAHCIEDSINSVLGQSYSGIELIIIDGGSTDGTIDIIKKYGHKISYWISEKDKGVYDAWNKGVLKAKGDWISFLGADDIFVNNVVISEVVPVLNAAEAHGIHYVYGKVKLLSISGERQITVWGEPWATAKTNIFKTMTITHCGAFHHKNMFKQHGLFDTSFRITGDYEFTLREFAAGKDAVYFDQLLTAMRAGGISADLRLKLTVARENIKAMKANQLPVLFHHKIQVFKAKLSNLLIGIVGMPAVKRGSDLYRRLTGKDPLWTKI